MYGAGDVRVEDARRVGHEFIGVVEEVGAEVRTFEGDLVVAPFVWSDGACVFCRAGLQTSCLHGGRYATASTVVRVSGARPAG